MERGARKEEVENSGGCRDDDSENEESFVSVCEWKERGKLWLEKDLQSWSFFTFFLEMRVVWANLSAGR